MSGTLLAHIMIVVAAVLGVAAMIGLVLLAARRPYFRNPHPDPWPGKVRGGIHLGDPRSQGPPENEAFDAPPDAAPPGYQEPGHATAPAGPAGDDRPDRGSGG